MHLLAEVGDRTYRVEVVRGEAGGHRVTLDGRAHLVEAVRVGADSWSLIVRNGDGAPRIVDASIAPQPGNGALEVHVGGHLVPVAFRTGLGRRTREAGGARGTGPERVVAPMPGKVVRVLVQPGEEVAARQGLIVVEAMKMENELRASRPGRVRDIFVTEGQSVEAGTALVVVE
jgi:biotin carboxyl carrier protein